MHELAYAEWLLAAVLDAADDRPIDSVTVRVGAMHAIVPDILRFSFHLVSEGTPADGARLDIVEVPSTLFCPACGKTSAFQPPVFECVYCRISDIQISTGEEFSVDGIVLDDGKMVNPKRGPQDSFLAHMKAHLEQEHQAPER